MTTIFERRQAILRVLQEQPGIKSTELANLLDVSIGTIRNDLRALQVDGQISRVHGGAVLIPQDHAILPTTIHNRPGKQRMAKRAIEMIQSEDAIWLDAGTTAQILIPELAQKENLTIITNGIQIAQEIAKQQQHQVLLIGGRVGNSGMYTIGTGNEMLLENVNIRTAFISGIGFTVEDGLTVHEYEDAQLKIKVINSAENVVALIDSSKIGKRGFAPVANLDQITHFITDKDIAPLMLRKLRQRQINVTVCGINTIRSHAAAQGRQKYLIGFANQSEQSTFAIDVRRGLESVAAERQDVDLVISNNKLSGTEALRVANRLIQRKVDLAIEYQIDHRSSNLIMDKFQRVNIPVIAVDIPMVGATYFGVENYRSGHMAGKALGNWIATHWQSRFDKLVIMDETRAGELPRSRIHGQLDGLEEVIGEVVEGKVVTLDSGNTLAISQSNMSHLLQELAEHQRVAVISFNDEAAVGAVEAARELGKLDHIVVVGQGADRLARAELRKPDTRLIGSTAFMPEQYGRRLIDIAIKILQGESLPPAIYMDHVFITLENLRQYYDN